MELRRAENTPQLGVDQDNLRHVVITATCFALVLSTASVALRLLCRKITETKVFLDDYLIIVALVFEYGISIAGVVLLYNGLGTHIIHVPPDKLTVYMKTLASGSFLYPLCITFIKLSILELYRRLFPVRPMILAVNIVNAVVILWCFGVCLIGIVTCIPFRKLWEPSIPGGCIDLTKFYYGLQIPNIVTDAVILAMPMRVVWNLHVSRARKVALSGVFLLGFLTLIFDIVRLVALIELSRSGTDITYNQVPASVWTCIEPAVGIMAACLSNMRPLLKWISIPIPHFTWLRNSPSQSAISDGRRRGSRDYIWSSTLVEVSSETACSSRGQESSKENKGFVSSV